MAGILVRARFPRRRLVQIVIANLFRYLFRGAARNWARNISSTAPALGSMALLLVLLGLVGLTGIALYNLDQVESGQASILHVYISDGADPAGVAALRERLSSDPRIASIGYTSKAEALQRAQSIPGLPELAGASDSNPFPASFDVQVKKIDDVAAIDAMVRNDIAVDAMYPTSYDRGAYQRIQTVIFGLGVAGFAFLSLLGFVAVTVTINSIRAAIIARRDEVLIMQLVGAPRWMVRGPFVVEGAITGALAGGLAGLVTFGLAAAGIEAAAGSFNQFAPGITITVAAIVSLVVFGVGLGLGSGSSLISIRRHLES